VGGAGQGRRQRVHARAHRHGAGQSQWGRSGDEVGRRKKEKEYFRNIFLRFVFTDNDLRLDFWNHKTRIRRLNSHFIVRVFTGLLEMLRASPAGRRIASERIRTHPNAFDRMREADARAPAVRRIRTDASGSTHPHPKFGASLRRPRQHVRPPNYLAVPPTRGRYLPPKPSPKS
jgi:hypothetical protein